MSSVKLLFFDKRTQDSVYMRFTMTQGSLFHTWKALMCLTQKYRYKYLPYYHFFIHCWLRCAPGLLLFMQVQASGQMWNLNNKHTPHLLIWTCGAVQHITAYLSAWSGFQWFKFRLLVALFREIERTKFTMNITGRYKQAVKKHL